MKRVRILVPAFLAIGLIMLAFWWSRRSSGFASPEACLAAFYQSAKDGDSARYIACLGDPLRSRQREDLGDFLRAATKDLKAWVQPAEAVIDGAQAQVDIDERRPGSRQRVQYRLERQGGSWLIVDIGRPRELPEHIPYGTHIKEGNLP